MTDRDLALSAIERLPEDVSLEEVTDELALIDALRKAVRQANEGKKKCHEEVRELFRSWITA
jgi:hypothetical protein